MALESWCNISGQKKEIKKKKKVQFFLSSLKFSNCRTNKTNVKWFDMETTFTIIPNGADGESQLHDFRSVFRDVLICPDLSEHENARKSEQEAQIHR